MTDKEKTIKELKEALDGLDITNKYRLNLIRVIEYLQEEHVSEDLEEASYRFACKCQPLKTEYSTSSPNPEVIEAFKNGAKWQKEQMMKEAIDTEVCERITQNGLLPSVTVLANGFKVRDKVKVIVIKED